MNVVSLDERRDREVNASVERHPSHQVKERALLEAEKWSLRIDVAREGYAEAVAYCKELGISNVAIARRVGKTEAAIRMFVQRRKLK